MAPPPTPTSLMDLPASWLLKLATSKRLARDRWRREPAVPLFRTCAFFRDTVLQHRTARAGFSVPAAAERFPAELARLCTVARRSSNVRLQLWSEEDMRWEDTEPPITHLLVCAMAELGGPLTCVKEVHTQWLEQTALVPAWLKVCCPNVESLEIQDCTLTPHLLDLASPPDTAAASRPNHGSPAPLTCQHLQRMDMGGLKGQPGGAQWQQHIRQQLAALPRLTSLVADNEEWMPEPALVSATVTSLAVGSWDGAQPSPHLAAQFPNLRELDAGSLVLDDAWLEALLRLPHLERLTVEGLHLHHSHTHRTWAVRHLSVRQLDVAAFARLPLDGVQACTVQEGGQPVAPTDDAQAVARVAEAVRRWGELAREGVKVNAEDSAALLTTLGPLLAALPAAQRREVWICTAKDATPATLRALGQQLPDGVATLQLWCCTLQLDAWPALLPSLPASVTELRVSFSLLSTVPAEEQLVALCGAAVRPIRLAVRDVPAHT